MLQFGKWDILEESRLVGKPEHWEACHQLYQIDPSVIWTVSGRDVRNLFIVGFLCFSPLATPKPFQTDETL